MTLTRRRLVSLSLVAASCGCQTIVGANFDGARLEPDVSEPSSCVPEVGDACYAAPPETLGVGTCRAGVVACAGDCLDQVVPLENEDVLSAGDDDCDGRTGNVLQAHRFGGPGGITYGLAAASMPDDGVVLYGMLQSGTASFGGDRIVPIGVDDVFLARLDASGGHLWSKSFGTPGIDYSGYADTDASGTILITGASQGSPIDFGGGALVPKSTPTPFVATFDADGAPLSSWLVEHAGVGSGATCNAKLATGADVVLVCRFEGWIQFPGDAQIPSDAVDLAVARIDGATRTTEWSRTFGGPGVEWQAAFAVSDGGDVFVSMHASGVVDVGGVAIGEAGQDNGVLVALAGGDGSVRWSSWLGRTTPYNPGGVAIDDSGDVVVSRALFGAVDLGGTIVSSEHDSDVMVARFTADGAPVWAHAFGGVDRQTTDAVVIDSTGDVVVGGSFRYELLDLALDSEAFQGFVLKLAPTGERVWWRAATHSARTIGESYIGPVASTSKDAIWVSGVFTGVVDAGHGTPLLESEGQDIFLLQLAR